MTIEVRTYGSPVKSRIALAALAVVALGAGAVLLAIGLAVVAALAVGGVILGLGFAVLRRFRRPAAEEPAVLVRHGGMREVFPDESVRREALPTGSEVVPDEPPER